MYYSKIVLNITFKNWEAVVENPWLPLEGREEGRCSQVHPPNQTYSVCGGVLSRVLVSVPELLGHQMT